MFNQHKAEHIVNLVILFMSVFGHIVSNFVPYPPVHGFLMFRSELYRTNLYSVSFTKHVLLGITYIAIGQVFQKNQAMLLKFLFIHLLLLKQISAIFQFYSHYELGWVSLW